MPARSSSTAKPSRSRSPADAQDLGIATIFQDLALCDNLDVVANLWLGRELVERAARSTRSRWSSAPGRCCASSSAKIPSVRIPVAALSGGQRQTVAIARSLDRRAARRHPRRADRRARRRADRRGAQPHRAPARARPRRHPHQPQHGRRAGRRRPRRRAAARPQQRRLQRRRRHQRDPDRRRSPVRDGGARRVPTAPAPADLREAQDHPAAVRGTRAASNPRAAGEQ